MFFKSLFNAKNKIKNCWKYEADNVYYYWFQNLATCMFNWKNVPETIDTRFLELCLYYDGKAVFFMDEELGYLGLQVLINGQLNVYRVPINRTAYAINGYHHSHLTPSNSVIIYNNYSRTNTFNTVLYYTNLIAEIQKTIDINLYSQRTPITIKTTENQRLTTANAYKKYDGFSPVIVTDESFDTRNFQVLNTQAPYLVDKLQQQKRETTNECLAMLGITSINSQKKERLISDEVLNDSSAAIASRNIRLQARKDACEKINKVFGLNMDVEFNNDVLQFEFKEYDDEGGEPINE